MSDTMKIDQTDLEDKLAEGEATEALEEELDESIGADGVAVDDEADAELEEESTTKTEETTPDQDALNRIFLAQAQLDIADAELCEAKEYVKEKKDKREDAISYLNGTIREAKNDKNRPLFDNLDKPRSEPEWQEEVEELDERYNEAVVLVVSDVSMEGITCLDLQNALEIRPNHASRLIARMQEDGIVTEREEGDGYDVIITAEEWEAKKESQDSTDDDDEAWRDELIEQAMPSLTQSICDKMREAGINNMGDLQSFSNSGKGLTAIKGIGRSAAEKIVEASLEFFSK